MRSSAITTLPEYDTIFQKCLSYNFFLVFTQGVDQDLSNNQVPEPIPMDEDQIQNDDKTDDTEDNNEEIEKRKRKCAEDFLNEPKAPLGESWEPLEPHEVTTIAKPIRKGRRKLVKSAAPNPDKLKKSTTKSRGGESGSAADSGNGPANGLVKVTVPIEEFLIQELKKGPNSISNFVQASNIAAVIHDEAVAELRNRKFNLKEQAKDNNENIADKLPNENPDDNNEELGNEWEDFPLDTQDADDFIPDVMADNQALAPPDPDPNADHSKNDTLKDDQNVQNKDSYEELVMKRVAAYVTQSQDYIQSTDLAKRVRAWHENLAPKLELVERRGDFDIHEYGSKILNKFPTDQRKTTLDFCDVAAGTSHEEVARLFLSSLMLANAQNVEISCSASKKEFLPMDKVNMTLLTTQRHHEHMLENIPESQDDIVKKRRKKAKNTKESRKKNLEAIIESDEEEHGQNRCTGQDQVDQDLIDQEYRETLDAFEAIPVSKKNDFAMPSTSSVPFTVPQSPTSSKSKGGRI